jgi:hypothetical protein
MQYLILPVMASFTLPLKRLKTGTQTSKSYFGMVYTTMLEFGSN